jgi:hypothetical protein
MSAASQTLPGALTAERRLGATVVVLLSLAIAGITAAILSLCQGHLIYSLDDPYISLALSDHIAHGHYGINADEAASPSSSILFPFLLAAFAWAPWQDWMPLIVNSAAACAAGLLFAREFCRNGIARPGHLVGATILLVTLCLSTNVVGLVFTGLEHSLHLATSVFVVFGIARTLKTDSMPRGLAVAIFLLPLWRFEGMALAGLALTALAIAGHRRTAFVTGLLICLAIGLYMTAMTRLGLPFLPSSVLVKSDVARQTAGGAAGLAALWQTVWANLVSGAGNVEAYPVYLFFAVALAHAVLRRFGWISGDPEWRSFGNELLFAGAVAGALLAHILFGAWGWFARYEAYVVAIGLAGSLVLWRRALAAAMARGAVAVVIGVLGLMCIGQRFLTVEAVTPIASLAIYEQNYQMRRFVVDFYRQPVGVNDIGWVSYCNPHYVLDLWGLGSETARLKRAGAAHNPLWLKDLVDARRIGVVIIYDEWFPGQIPESWRRLATLKAAHRMAAPFDTMSVYATSAAATPAVLTALREFGRDLGPGTTLTVFDPNFVAGDPR